MSYILLLSNFYEIKKQCPFRKSGFQLQPSLHFGLNWHYIVYTYYTHILHELSPHKMSFFEKKLSTKTWNQ